MRKITAVLMALALALSLFACGGEPVQDETPGSDIQQGTVILPKPQEDNEGGDSQNGEYPSAQDPLPQKPGDTKKPEEPDKAEDGKNPGKNEDNAQTPAEDPKQEENNNNNNGDNATTPSDTKVPSGEYRAVWISYLELGGMLTGKTAGQFRSNIGAAYDNVKNLGCNTVIVHVRPFGDALYDSDYFPSSYLITGTEGDNLPFDPLKIMVEEAHNRGLTFEAWLNPYRVRARTGKALCSDNPAQKYINSGSDAVYQTGRPLTLSSMGCGRSCVTTMWMPSTLMIISMLQLTVALIVPCTPQTAVENRWQPGEDRMSIPWCGKFMPQ